MKELSLSPFELWNLVTETNCIPFLVRIWETHNTGLESFLPRS